MFQRETAPRGRTRAGVGPARQPLSLLGLGDLGWIQVTACVLTGLLFIACAVGMRSALCPGPVVVRGPLLIGALVVFGSVTAAALVFARRFAARHERA